MERYCTVHEASSHSGEGRGSLIETRRDAGSLTREAKSFDIHRVRACSRGIAGLESGMETPLPPLAEQARLRAFSTSFDVAPSRVTALQRGGCSCDFWPQDHGRAQGRELGHGRGGLSRDAVAEGVVRWRHEAAPFFIAPYDGSRVRGRRSSLQGATSSL